MLLFESNKIKNNTSYSTYIFKNVRGVGIMGQDKELCVNCGKPIDNGFSFCSDKCDLEYRLDD